MKKNKIISVLMVLIALLNIFSVASFAESPSMTAEEFNNSLCNMITEYNETQMTPSSYYVLPPNRLIVKTNNNHVLKENYGAVDSVKGYNGIHIFQYSSVSKTDAAYEEFLKDDIEYVEYDFYIKIDEITNTKSSEPISTEFSTWNSEVAQVEDAFKFIEEYGIVCNEVKVGIIDSGVFAQHSAFTKNEKRIFDSGYALENEQTGEIYSSLDDEVNHGSHVTGIIYNNTMSNVKLYPYRVFPIMDIVSYSCVYGAFVLAVSQEMDIINMSLAGTYKETNSDCITLNQAIVDATNNGIVVVVAAGNNCGNSDKICPANCPAAITVAATNKQNSPDITYSASGECVDIAAPGTKIASTVPRYYTKIEALLDETKIYDPIPQSLFKEMSGTSMATPLVTAAAAMLKSIQSDLSALEIQRIIKEAAYTPEGWKENYNGKNYGIGIVNFYNIVKMVSEPESSSTPTIEINSDNKFVIASSNHTNSRIYYTLDGTIPTIDSHLTYSEPLNLRNKHATKITAVCHENGKFIGEPVVYDMINYNTKTIFYKWSVKLSTDADTKNANWQSYNPEIASVDNEGNITGKSKGTTSITCRLQTGERIVYKVNVKYSPLQAFFVIFFFGFLWI